MGGGGGDGGASGSSSSNSSTCSIQWRTAGAGSAQSMQVMHAKIHEIFNLSVNVVYHKNFHKQRTCMYTRQVKKRTKMKQRYGLIISVDYNKIRRLLNSIVWWLICAISPWRITLSLRPNVCLQLISLHISHLDLREKWGSGTTSERNIIELLLNCVGLCLLPKRHPFHSIK